ncbi:hypothetical protein U1Q18_026186 [Sarracenia purpurea var. burkii]
MELVGEVQADGPLPSALKPQGVSSRRTSRLDNPREGNLAMTQRKERGQPSSSSFAPLDEDNLGDMEDNMKNVGAGFDAVFPDVTDDILLDKGAYKTFSGCQDLEPQDLVCATPAPESSDCRIVNDEDFLVLKVSLTSPGRSGSPSSKEPPNKNQSSSKKKKKR